MGRPESAVSGGAKNYWPAGVAGFTDEAACKENALAFAVLPATMDDSFFN